METRPNDPQLPGPDLPDPLPPDDPEPVTEPDPSPLPGPLETPGVESPLVDLHDARRRRRPSVGGRAAQRAARGAYRRHLEWAVSGDHRPAA